MTKKKTVKPKKKSTVSIKKQIGERFKQFRESLGKRQVQLAAELKVYQSTITNIEVGKTFPGIKYLHYLGQAYQLNVDWLLNNRGEMFRSPFSIPESMYEKYDELMKLMQVPVVEELLLARLEEVKVIAKEEIEAFQDWDKDAGSS